MKKRRVSIRDIAKATGYSNATISMAMRDHPRIPATTRERIRQAALELGYRPDPMLKALAEYRREKIAPHYRATLAWVEYFPAKGDLEACSPDFAEYKQGALVRAEELGYHLEIFRPLESKLSPAALRRILTTRGVEGILLPPQPKPNTVLDFDFSPFSVVSFGYTLKHPRLHTVANNQYRSTLLVIKKLRALGYQRIAMMVPVAFDRRSEKNFSSAFLGEREDHPQDQRGPLIIYSREEYGSNRMEEHFKRLMEFRPDVIIISSRYVIEWLESKGVNIPEDIRIVGLEVGHDPLLSGVDQNPYEIGRVALDTLAAMIYKNERGVPAIPQDILIEGKWSPGEMALHPRL